MMLDIFKKPYTLRSFQKTEYTEGYPRARYSDRTVMLNVQPMTTNEILALPEGIRRDKNIKAIGKVEIMPADDAAGTLADRLLYRGQWYECTVADVWGNTPVGQTDAVFGLIPVSEIPRVAIVPDDGEKGNGEDTP